MESYGIRNQLPLIRDEVQVWCASLYVEADNLKRLFGSLSPEEEERARRFVLPVDQHRFVAAHGILRDLLGGYLRLPPAKVCIESAARGKPRLQKGPGALDVRFNLSHSDGLALYAFSLEREVGIDIEKIRPEFANEDMVAQYFSRQEQEDLRSMPSELRSEAFFRCWTRKEAYLKARGEGLHMPLDSFAVSFKPNEPAVLTSQYSENWRLYSLPPQPGFAVALVVEGPTCSVVYSEQ